MMLRRLAGDFVRGVPQWDAASKLSLVLGAALLLLTLGLGFFGPPAVQMPARIGAFGLLLTLQLLVLWGNRRAISPYHDAQQHFIKGDYAAARDILEQIPQSERVSVDALILLGNTYRHLGQFDESRRALERGLQLKPGYHFALYGIGKLHLVLGAYDDACDFIGRALAAGSPAIVQFDLGQAFYLRGDAEKARHCFDSIASIVADEPPQAMLCAYYRHRMGGSAPPDARSIRQNILFWQAEAAKYSPTAYGAALQADVAALRARLGDERG